jgi:hypothetical protein
LDKEILMRFFLVIGVLVLLGAELGHAESAEPRSGSQLIEVCNRDIERCQQLIGLIIKTGVEAEQLPPCTSSLGLPELTDKILNYWKLYPERAENPAVVAVAYALRSLKPC